MSPTAKSWPETFRAKRGKAAAKKIRKPSAQDPRRAGPSQNVEAQRAEVARLTATVGQLKQHGGDAQVFPCETRLCVRTDEAGKAPKVADAKKGETYRVIKGY